MGFTYQDMRHMPYHRIMWVLDEWRHMNEAPSGGGTRKATQEDIASILY